MSLLEQEEIQVDDVSLSDGPDGRSVRIRYRGGPDRLIAPDNEEPGRPPSP